MNYNYTWTSFWVVAIYADTYTYKPIDEYIAIVHNFNNCSFLSTFDQFNHPLLF